MPEFFGPLSRSAFLVNKKGLFLQKCIELLTVFQVVNISPSPPNIFANLFFCESSLKQWQYVYGDANKCKQHLIKKNKHFFRKQKKFILGSTKGSHTVPTDLHYPGSDCQSPRAQIFLNIVQRTFDSKVLFLCSLDPKKYFFSTFFCFFIITTIFNAQKCV